MIALKLLLSALVFELVAGLATAGIVGTPASLNLTSFVKHREKRTLIFEGGGTLKFVIGPTLPVNLGDPIVWRSLICSYNLHGGHYTIPTEPLYPWDKWEDIFERSLRRRRQDFEHNLKYTADDSRLFVYVALETYMDRQHANGRKCLLRSICENAQVDQHVGVLAEVLNIVLTPGNENIDAAYRAAYEAGKFRADCLKLYPECPMGANVFDNYLDEI